MKKLMFILIACIAMNLYAENNGKETNSKIVDKNQIVHVEDVNTGEDLAGVAININGETVYTDFDGNIILKIRKEQEVKINHISYENQTIKLIPNYTQNIKLKPIGD